MMSPFSIAHVLMALVALGAGVAIALMRKGTRLHRILGWTYAVLMLAGLVAITIAGRDDLSPFHGYALGVSVALLAAIAVSRLRRHVPGWRAWHAALMSFSMLAACVALGGVVGGVALGLPDGPGYYRMFNVVIAFVTALGLWLIATRAVIWGARPGARERAIRLKYGVAVIAVSVALIASQWWMYGEALTFP